MDAGSTAIVFQGLQNDFCAPEGKLYPLVAGQLCERRLVERIIPFLTETLDLGVRLCFVPIQFTPDYREIRGAEGILGSIRDLGAFRRGSPGVEPIDELRPLLPRMTVLPPKRGLCAFGSTELDEVLRAGGISTVGVCGLLTNVCVETTARSAYDRGYRVITIADLTVAKSAEEQSASERFIFPLLGRLMTSSEFLHDIRERAGDSRRAA